MLAVDHKGGPGDPDRGARVVLDIDAKHRARADDEVVKVGPFSDRTIECSTLHAGLSLSSCLATARSPSPPSRQARSSV